MYEEFNRRIYGVIKDRIFLSNISGMPATVVEKLPEEIVEGEVLFDGMMLYNGVEGIEDDIQQMNSVTKDGERVNLEDYYTDNGAFDDDGLDRFIAALERLMTIDDATGGELRSIHLDSGVRGEEFPIFLRTLAYMYPERYVPMWEKYHGEHPEVEYSREECLAWAEIQQEMFRQNASVKDHLPGLRYPVSPV